MAERAIIAASSGYWHIASPFGLREYIVNGLLVRDLVDFPSVDWVSWTLLIELKFYLFAAIVRLPVLNHRVWPLVGVAVAALALKMLWIAHLLPIPGEVVTGCMFVGYIAIGTLFHYRYQAAISSGRCALWVVTLLVLFMVNYQIGPTRSEYLDSWRVLVSYSAAVFVFAGCYAARDRFRPNRVLDALAAVSYPLYLVHAVTGFTILSFLNMAWHVPFALAATAAALCSVLLASALHVWIEKPTITLGHQLSASKSPVLSTIIKT